MKTILAATDFSKIAHNAINYAAEMAKLGKARLVLFHAFHLPMVTSEIPIPMITMDEMDRECMSALKKLSREIHEKHGKGIRIECKCACGFASEEISKAAAESEADLVVMGMRGAGYIAQKLFGSITTSLVKRSETPVLVINEHVRFKDIKRIALACDYKDTPICSVFNPVKEMAKLFNAKICAFNVVKELEPITIPDAAESLRLEHALEATAHSYQFIYNDNVVDGIDDFVHREKMDMLVMIPHDKGVFGNLFRIHHTAREAFHTRIPLLTIKA